MLKSSKSRRENNLVFWTNGSDEILMSIVYLDEIYETLRLINMIKFINLEALEATSLWPESVFYFFFTSSRKIIHQGQKSGGIK